MVRTPSSWVFSCLPSTTWRLTSSIHPSDDIVTEASLVSENGENGEVTEPATRSMALPETRLKRNGNKKRAYSTYPLVHFSLFMQTTGVLDLRIDGGGTLGTKGTGLPNRCRIYRQRRRYSLLVRPLAVNLE